MEKTFENKVAIANIERIGRSGESEEIANTVMFLCSNTTSFITGDPITLIWLDNTIKF